MSRKKPARVNQWKLDNEAFLAEKAKEEGVTVLDNGVIIQTLEKGHGSIHPRPGSLVYAHYTGRLVDGKVFDSTEGESLPALFRVRDLIMGWQIALVRMFIMKYGDIKMVVGNQQSMGHKVQYTLSVPTGCDNQDKKKSH